MLLESGFFALHFSRKEHILFQPMQILTILKCTQIAEIFASLSTSRLRNTKMTSAVRLEIEI